VSFLLTITIIFNIVLANENEKRIVFHSADHSKNVDYHSFAPLMMLKHEIGNFRKLPKNPVLEPSNFGWDKKDVSDPFVMVTPDSIYIYYDGSNNNGYKIGYAVLDPTGWNWQKRKKILPDGNNGWDSHHQINPIPLIYKNQFRIYYSGNDSDSEFGYQIGMVIKEDNSQWKYPSSLPVFGIDSTRWDFSGIIYSDIHYFPEHDIFKMWYTGFQGPLSAIGLAESEDGIYWKRVGDEPVFNIFPGVIAPEVIFNGEKYFMYFTQLVYDDGLKTIISRTESEDGIHWEGVEPILKPELRWERSKLMKPNLSYFDGRVHLYYCAQKGSTWRIGASTADAHFIPEGNWRSRRINSMAESISIIFEKPEGTEISISLIDSESLKTYKLSMSGSSRELRRGVLEKKILFPDSLKFHHWQIELGLRSTVENRSPLIYELKIGSK
jgi:predicted GH43/DUF377 family glycosyl hydrolase